MKDPETTITMDELERGLQRSQNHGQSSHVGRDVPRGEYHETYVAPKLDYRPWLDILHEFVDPKSQNFAISPEHRLSFFDIDVVHISASGDVHPPIKCRDAQEFHAATSGAEGETRCGTIVLAEDISGAVIDALGMQYQLEPEFFANHLLGTELFRTGKWQSPGPGVPARAPNILPDYLRKAPFYATEFRRPCCIPGGLKKLEELRSTMTNTPRAAQLLRDDLPEMFVYDKISVYNRSGSNFGVILTDKVISDAIPSSYMLDVVTTLQDTDNTPRRRQVSSRAELLSYLHHLPRSAAQALFAASAPPLALHPALKLVERAAAIFLDHARYLMSRIVVGHSDAHFPDSIPFFMRMLRSLYRHMHDHHRITRLALRMARLKGGPECAEQLQDLQFLADEMEIALKTLEEDVRFLVAAASIREGKIVGWVSKFAFLFLPVSLLATVLALMDAGYARWAILAGLSVPFATVSAYFMFLWTPSDIDSFRSYSPQFY